MMRIITGKARGIKLKTLEGESTRPTAERVKEAVFSILQLDIENRKVLDLYSGSGQLALEASSRGAEEAVMIDSSIESIKIIQENAEKTKLKDSCRTYHTNALDFIKRNSGTKFDLIFLDPPYASKLYIPTLNALLANEMLKPSSIIVCESDYDFLDSDLTEKFSIIKSSQYGKILVTILTPNI